jgi:hypothetical protein
MRDDRFEVSVTFDERRGYVATAPELRSPVTALSLGDLRRRIEALMLPDNVNVRLVLDRSAERVGTTIAAVDAAAALIPRDAARQNGGPQAQAAQGRSR